MDEDYDLIEGLERIDRFFDGTEPGQVPLEVLREAGMEIPEDDAALDDAALGTKLREIIDALFTFGMLIEQTDHLSDRELYRWLVGDALREETILSAEGLGAWHVSPIGGCSDADIEIHLRFYADDEERSHWEQDLGVRLPPKEPRPYDRDRFLPSGERAASDALQ